MAAKGGKRTSGRSGPKVRVGKKQAKAKATPKPARTTTGHAAKKKAAPKKAAPKKKALATKKATPKKKGLAPKKAPPKKKARVQRASATKPSPARVPRARPSAPNAPQPPTEAAPSQAPLASPTERLLAACAEVPTERSLTDEEREAMAKVSETARLFVGAEGEPEQIIGSIAAFVDEVRRGERDEPSSQDVRLGLGVLWGEQLRAQVGWRWVHLSYPDGFASYALVPDDRAFACFPLNRVPEALKAMGTNTSARVFASIRENELPTRKKDAYLVIG